MTEIVFNPDTPLSRIPHETTRALNAFHDYVDMGAGRSLPLLTKGYRGEIEQSHELYAFFAKYRSDNGNHADVPPSKHQRTIENWSSRFHWQARLARLLEIRAAQRETLRLQRMRELEDADWQQGQELRDKVGELLAELEKFKTARVQWTTDPQTGEKVKVVTVKFKPSLSQVSTAARTASELQRLAVGAATQNNRIVDREGEDRDLPIVGIEVINPNEIVDE